MSSDHIRVFQESVEPFLQDWQSVEIRALAQMGRQGSWVLHAYRAILSPLPPSEPARGDLQNGPVPSHENRSH